MADPLLILRENRTGLDAWLVNGRGKSQPVQALGRVVYEDLETVGEDHTLFDAGLVSVIQAIDPAIKKDSAVQVMLLLPAGRFYFRNISLPFTSRAKIRQVLPLELKTRFPKEMGPVVTDFFQYELKTQQSTPLVFSGSIEEDILKSYHASLTAAGLKPVAIAPGSLAMVASFLKQNKDKTNFVFLDMDGCELALILVAQGNIVQVRTLAGEAASQLPIQAIRQMLLGVWQRFGVTEPFNIYISGELDESARKGMHKALADFFKFQSDFTGQDAWEPELPESITGSAFVDVSRNIVLLSPDLRMLNMCRGKYGSDSFIRAYAGYIASCCALALLAFILFMVNIHMDISRLEKQVDQHNQAMAAIYKKAFPDKRIGNIDPLLLMQASVGELTRGGSANADAENLDRVPAGSILVELSRCIPGAVDVQVDRLMLDKRRMILSGSADNYNTIDQVKGFIEKSPFFKKVNIGSAVAGKGGKRVDFKFIIEI
ncbi:general secretion pathway protein GspL [Desulfobacter hydrogenophilus]|uniref:General secretion pathway protein GspL n=1 Tax=Desulfobacter hydrogenophilus TaxID=2291 RepID=A0A328FH84_9BACT|nr:PilN domain-containing protein [Desulfobacter hydrogenophilus]NDY70864.1 general secretion pathway protein GspL [Desulfobacter hydrogenophilus]QBH11634.1 general secretion pathway protein GspL [Desulfobacter hydrogenophilus]RAM03180.1 general secretion pathway protein GspL [Desulfobacter hydrogenophilus]